VVVTVGLTLAEPLADVDVNVPGVMAMLVAPLVAQLSVLVEPELMLSGLAVNEVMVGTEPFPGDGIDGVVEPQPASKEKTNNMRMFALRSRPKDLNSGELGLLLQEDLVEPIKVSLQLGELSFQPECPFALPTAKQYTQLPSPGTKAVFFFCFMLLNTVF
jgi:hypothetical protein